MLPDLREDDAPSAVLYRRSAGRRHMCFEVAIDPAGRALPFRNVHRALRKLPSQGIIEGHYGWFRKEFVRSFLDWTIYGHPAEHLSTVSDEFVLTRNFFVHAQRDLGGSPVLNRIERSRYGVPLYRMNPSMMILPIYLRGRLTPPKSAHQRLAQMQEFGAELRTVLGLLSLDDIGQDTLTWLTDENYV